jgi:protein phosphatase
MTLYQSAWSQTQGARNYQEDSAVRWPEAAADNGGPALPHLLVVLADGMGGHAGGALASRTVCGEFRAAFAGGASTIPDRLRTALTAANDGVAREVMKRPSLHGMGSTLVGASFGPDGLEWISVGDSPLLLYRRGEVELINEDHSLAPALDQLAASGEITLEEARHDPRRHMLRSAITGDKPELVDLSSNPLRLDEGDYVIVASDGIHALERDEIARIVTAYGQEGCEPLAAALIRAIENVRDPHQDNATVVVVQAIAD